MGCLQFVWTESLKYQLTPKNAASQVFDIGDHGLKSALIELDDVWHDKSSIPIEKNKNRFLDSLEKHASIIRTVAGAIIAVGVIVAVTLTIPNKIRELTEVSFNYVATPKVVAYQYAFPAEGAQSQADGLLAFGQQVSVKCKRNDKKNLTWLMLANEKWVRKSDFSPAEGEKPLSQLPECN
jgi:hypothetical protein